MRYFRENPDLTEIAPCDMVKLELADQLALAPTRFDTYDDASANRNPIRPGDQHYPSAPWELHYIEHPTVFKTEVPRHDAEKASIALEHQTPRQLTKTDQ